MKRNHLRKRWEEEEGLREEGERMCEIDFFFLEYHFILLFFYGKQKKKE
jgi:hypothetical protein